MALTQLVIEDFEGTRTVVPLDMDALTIGRGDGHLIQLTEQNVSRDHAKLYLMDEGWVVEDLGSFNGINVNNVEVKGAVILREGDLITIGDYIMQLAGDSSRDTVELVGAGVATDSLEGRLTKSEASGPRMVGAATEQLSDAAEAPEPTPSAIVDKNTPLDGVHVAPSPATDDGLDEFDFDDESTVGKKIVFGVILLVVAVVGWNMLRSDSEDASAPKKSAVAGVEKPASKRTAEKPEDTEQAEPAAGTSTVGDDAAGTDGAAAGDTGTGDDGEAPTDEPEATPEEADAPAPTPVTAPRRASKRSQAKPAKTKSAPAPEPTATPEPAVQEPTPKVEDPAPVTASKTASELLAEARKAAMLGQAAKAYDLAKQSHTKSPSADAIQVMAVSACKMGSESKAKAAFTRLSEKKKKSVRALCESKGISL